MPVRTAEAEWKGDLSSGNGTVGSGRETFAGSYSAGSRFGEAEGTNPEELIAAAHAGCFSMALSAGLSKTGHAPDAVRTTAKVHLDRVGEGFGVTLIELVCEAEVPGISEELFRERAAQAKAGCPVSRALAAVDITLDATLLG